jgi:hypothetical protein
MRGWPTRIVILLGSVIFALGLGAPPDARAQKVKKPSQIYRLVTTTVVPSSTEDLIGPDGPFSVPSNKVFVIRTINIFPITPAPGVVSILLKQGNSTPAGWNVPLDGPTFIPYPAGFKLFGGGDKVLQIESPTSSDGAVKVEVNGILYKDK